MVGTKYAFHYPHIQLPTIELVCRSGSNISHFVNTKGSESQDYWFFFLLHYKCVGNILMKAIIHKLVEPRHPFSEN